jgi:hypothetical protein
VRRIVRGASVLVALAMTPACSASTKSTAYVSSMRTVEKKVGGTHLTDQQLVALGKTICRNLSVGEPRKQQVALANTRLGNTVAGTAAYFLAIQEFCPNQAIRWVPFNRSSGSM